MAAPLLSAWEGIVPIIGMVHLLPLPGSPGFAGNLEAIRFRALRDADALVTAGVDGLIVENLGDTPYHPGRVPPATVAYMTVLTHEIRQGLDVPVGVNVLRNDGVSALGAAHAAGAQFVRVNVLTGARVTDQGVLQGIAHELLRERQRLGATHIRILADVAVKHSTPLGDADARQEVGDAVQRGGADGIIVSGSGTGGPVDRERLRVARQVAGRAPVFVGSGVTADSVADLLEEADGVIVGSWLKMEGLVTKPVDPQRVRALLTAAGR